MPAEEERAEAYQTLPGTDTGMGGRFARMPEADESSDIRDLGVQAVQGTLEGLAKMTGMPADMSAAVMSAITGKEYDRPLGGSQRSLEDIRYVMGDNTPEGPAGRITRRSFEEVGANVVPAALVLKIAKATNLGMGAARTVAGRVWRDYLVSVKNNPMGATLNEFVSAWLGGIGAGIAREETDSSLAEAGAQVTGGMLPAAAGMTPTGVIARTVRNVATPQRAEEAAKEAARAHVGKVMGNLDPEAQANMAQAERVSGEIPGFSPNLAEATGDPKLIATARSIESTAQGDELDQIVQHRRLNDQAVAKYREENAPKGEVDPEFVIDRATGKLTDLRTDLAAQTDRATTARGRLSESLERSDRADIGAGIRTRLGEARTATSRRMSKLSRDLGIADSDQSLVFKDIRDYVKENFIDTRYFRKVRSKDRPQAIRDILNFGKKKNRTFTFQDFKDLRENVSNELIDALGSSSPNSRKIRALMDIKKHLDDSLEDLAGKDLTGRYKEFRDTYFKEFVSKFETGAAYKARHRDGTAFYQTPDEAVAGHFFGPGQVSSVRQYKAIFGDDPEAIKALEAYALDTLRDSAVRDGVLSRSALESWTRRHASVLDELPGLKRKTENIQRANESLYNRQQYLTEQKRLIDNTVLAKRLDTYGTKTADELVDDAIRQPEFMRQLVSQFRSDPDGLSALRRTVWDRVTGGKAEDILKFSIENRSALRQLFPEKHLKNIDTIMLARTIIERVPQGTAAPYQVRPLADIERSIGIKLPMLANRIREIHTGRSEIAYTVTNLLTNIFSRRSQAVAEDLFREAMYDPALARDLANSYRVGNISPIRAKRLRTRYAVIGVTPFFEEEEQ